MRQCKAPNCTTRLPPYKESNRHEQMGCCSDVCSYALFKQKQAEKAEKQRIALKASEKAHKASKRKVLGQDIKKQKCLTQAAVNRLARLLDKMQGFGCISCGRPDNGEVQFCGGHFLTRGAHPEMRFDLRNIHGQCNQYCNKNLSGNIEGTKTTHGYKQGIINRYGPEYLEWLESYHPPVEWTCESLIEMRKLINQEIRRIERGEGASRDWRKL